MSTFSQDLDYFDASVFDPLTQIPKESPLADSKSKDENPEESLTENEDETEQDEDDDEEEEGETDGKELLCEVECPEEEEKRGEECRPEMLEKCTQDAMSEKDDKTDSKFSTELWSGAESTTSRSLDSWDLPPGTIPWDDKEKPMELLLNYADLALTAEEENGLLTDRIVAACSSYLTESPENKCHVAAKVSLNNKNLNDIRILGYHRFLQYVDLSWNNLKDLTPLGCIPYLMYLDVSHNLLEEVLRFRPPMNLTYVNYSYNEVWQIDDLTDFWTLCFLNLSHNKISKIQGLHNLRFLRHLDLSHNKIERFENLSNLRITDLNLEYNLISKFEIEPGLGLYTMPYLTNLHLNNNLITTLKFLKNVYHLKKLELQGNHISDMVELTEMKHLKNLRHLDLSGNPVSNQKPYRSLLIGFLQELRFLDQIEVDISERVAACKKNRLDVQLEAARNSIRMILMEQFNDPSLGLDVLPVDQGSYPFVILVGPSASSKKRIMSCLAEKYEDKIYLGKLHTTRKVLNGERHLLEHASKENFKEMTKAGKFLCISENLGHFYGFSRDELGKAIKDQKLCLTSMDVVSALTVHTYGIRPFLILTILQSKEEHSRRLKMTYGPVLSLLGAAYMAQRQLIDTHESNLKRVSVILDDIIKEAEKRICVESVECEECMKEGKHSESTFNTERRSTEYSSDTEISSEVVAHYDSSRQCYPCTPNKCGFQTCMDAGPDYESSTNSTSEDCHRMEALVENVQVDSTTTSYSSEQSSPTKKECSSLEEYSYGEEEPFSDWSLPFVDWSEVNLSGLQLEEAAELLCDKYVENVMSTRDIYENLHVDNPGLFSLCVFTDTIAMAVKSIAKFLKDVWRSTPLRKPTFDVKDDLAYQAFVPKKLDQLKEILHNDFLSSGDGSAKDIPDSAPAHFSPTSATREMRLKGYGDSFDEMP